MTESLWSSHSLKLSAAQIFSSRGTDEIFSVSLPDAGELPPLITLLSPALAIEDFYKQEASLVCQLTPENLQDEKSLSSKYDRL